MTNSGQEPDLSNRLEVETYRFGLIQKACNGCAKSARRLGQLGNQQDDPQAAGYWWHRAADMGDDEAIRHLEQARSKAGS